MTSLETTAKALVAHGKGILAADESSGTIKKRFDAIGLESTEEHRRMYREMLFTAPNIEPDISGVILYDETIHQSSRDGVPFPKLLESRGIIPGIKVDMGAKDLALHPGEKVTEGLDGLRERLAEYAKLGARFAKWRGVITIGNDIPSEACISANAHALAMYAALCQEAGIVPIVEPEVLMDGGHTIERCYEVTTHTLHTVYEQLAQQDVSLPGTLLKPNMVISGSECATQADTATVATQTIRALRAEVPEEVSGIVFLSGGQTDQAATANLNAINQQGQQPWPLTFSYGRALQAAAIQAWHGKDANFVTGQAAFAHRARCNGAASKGEYTPDMEAETAIGAAASQD